MVNRLASDSLLRLSSLAALLFACAPLCFAEEDFADSLASRIQRIFHERQDAVVRVEATDAHGKIYGTGFYTDPAGTIYTLAAIVDHADEIWVLQGDRKVPAKLLVSDPRSGVAIIKTDTYSPFIPMGDASQLGLASPVMTISFPMDLPISPSLGTIGGFDRKFLGKFFVTTHIRANLPVQPGSLGAPLLNLKGEVVGILIGGLDGGTACYALPIKAAEKIRMDYARFGEVRYGSVGVKVEEEADAVEGSTVKIVDLSSDTPAAQSGLQEGDVLLKVGDTKIATAEDVLDASFFLTAGDQVAITVSRNGQKLSFNVKPFQHPSSPELNGYDKGKELRVLGQPTGTTTIQLDSSN